MTNITLNFIFKGEKLTIQCKDNEFMKNIFERYSIKIGKNVQNLFFLYKGQKLENNKKLSEYIKNEKIITIIVDEINNTFSKEKQLKQLNYIICPKCFGISIINFDEYKIKINKCDNNHSLNISIKEIKDLQNIDESKILCKQCHKNKSETAYYKFNFCGNCNCNFCPLCVSKHNKGHKIIDYDLKNYNCFTHGERFISFCKNCINNLCDLCEIEHNENHDIISYKKIIQKENITKNNINELRLKIDNLKKEVSKIINKLNEINKKDSNISVKTLKENKDDNSTIINKMNEVINYFELFYSMSYNIIIKFDIKNKNYQLLMSIKNLNQLDIKIIKDIHNIINENKIENKINLLNIIYEKIKSNKQIENLSKKENNQKIIDKGNKFILEHKKDDKNKKIQTINSKDEKYTKNINKDKQKIKEQESNPPIIIDIGSGYIKAGIGGEEGPRCIFPTCIGYPKFSNFLVDNDRKEFFVGIDAEIKCRILKVNYPIEKGVINNWDDIEKIFEHVFENELKIDPTQQEIFLIDNLFCTKKNREEYSKIMFETFCVPKLYISNSSVLSLFSEGKFDGFIIDSGDSVTQFSPILDGKILSHASIGLDLAGRNLTEYMIKLLEECGIRLTTTADKIYGKLIKEKACYVALDFEEELKNVKNYKYVLPDNRDVIVKDQRFRCPEALFKPSMIGKEENGFGQTCYDSIQKCNKDFRKNLFNNIFLSGGNSFFKGFQERLTKEIKRIAPKSMKKEVKVFASSNRKFSAWIGGSILTSISSFQSNWITKAEYEEYGATIVHRKCS